MLRIVALLLIVSVTCTGCTFGGPKTRLGSLPFPAALSLWDAADPSDLGEHIHEAGTFEGLAESSRGTVYTCKAGFVDVAHLRESADWTKFAYDEVLDALRQGKPYATFEDHYRAEYRIALNVPEVWSRYSADARRSEEERAARVAAQRIAYLAMTWHEVATWFGERIIPFIPEDRSSFTYDDTIAHIIGVRLGGEALGMVTRKEAPDFDQAMTIALNREMTRLGALSTEETYDAALAVEGKWWEGEDCTKRQLATGLDEGFMTPWIIHGFEPCPAAVAENQKLTWEDRGTLRSLNLILGSVEMRSESYAETLGLVPGQVTRGPAGESGTLPTVSADGWVFANDLMRRSVDVLRVSMRAKFGEHFDSPE